MRYTRTPATNADREFIYALKRETLAAYVIQTWGLWDEAAQRERFDANFEPDTWELIVVDEARVGGLALEWEPSRVWLVNLELLPAYQRQGLGTALLKEVLGAARRRGLPVELKVLRVNPARALYERLGFTVAREEEALLWMRREVG